MAEYVTVKLLLSDESRAVLHHIKLDMVASFQLSWRGVHNNLLIHLSIALEIYQIYQIPPFDEAQKMDLLHASFRDHFVWRELAKLQEAIKEPSACYNPCPYIGRGRSYNYKRGFSQREGQKTQ